MIYIGSEVVKSVPRPLEVLRVPSRLHRRLRGRGMHSFHVQSLSFTYFYLLFLNFYKSGVYLGDLVLMDDGNPDRVTLKDVELINLPKYALFPFFLCFSTF